MTREETWDTEKSMRKDENLSETGGGKISDKIDSNSDSCYGISD